MAEPSDEMLMAYVDGELPPDERARLEQTLARDPASRARLAQFVATGRGLLRHFDGVLREPVPDALVALVMGADVTPASGHQPSRSSRPPVGFLEHIRSLLASGLPLRQVAFAGLATMLLGAGLGWQFAAGARQGAQALFAIDDGLVLAHGALERALETERSSVPVVVDGGADRAATLQMRLTFKTGQDAYCRQYTLSQADNRQFSGIGCRRDDGRWLLHAHTQIENRKSASGSFKPAGDGPSMIAAIVEKTMAGEAFGAAEEATLIGSKWRR